MAAQATIEPAKARTHDPARYSRRRAVVLASVYAAMVAHIVHWKLAGKTLAPLELNEVVYALAEGTVTAGFVLLALACLATAVFGRFFCSWGCHLLALQDLCAWLLKKVGIKPRPLRSRVLRWMPIVAALYMFGFPFVWRAFQEGGVPSFHLRTDADGWASFATSDFWRNLPGVSIIALTFGVCGFAIVYALGSRAFCQSICPYGAVFAALDRVAPGRIVARGDCGDCSICTTVCQSNISVHVELAKYGAVVDSRCLRDLDCVAACPDGKAAFAFARPTVARAGATRGLPKKYDLTGPEELLLAAAFVLAFFALRGVYDAIPFLLALACAAIAAAMVVYAARVLRRRDVRFLKIAFASDGRIERGGAVFLGLSGVVFALIAHSGWIRWHEFAGRSALAAAERAPIAADARAHAGSAREHFDLCRRFGLVRSDELELRWARAAELTGDVAEAERTLARLDRSESAVALALARVWTALGRQVEARELLASALRSIDDESRGRRDVLRFEADANALIGEIAAHAGELDEARARLRRACELEPGSALAHYQLGVVLAALGEGEAALGAFERSCTLNDLDADAHNNAGMLLLERGRADEAERHLRRAIASAPGHAAARFNLGRVLLARGQRAEAEEHLARARGGGAEYARAVDELLARR
jgi:tetratricopeptide (TPR) repeat protein